MIPISYERLNLNLRRAGRQGRTDWKGRTRRIYDHELMVCIKGEIHYTEGDRHALIKAGELLLIKPNTPHVVWINEALDNEVIWVHFDYDYREDIHDINNIVTGNQEILYDQELPRQHLLRDEVSIDGRIRFPNVLRVNHEKQATKYMRQLLELYNDHYPLWQLEAKIVLMKLWRLILSDQENLILREHSNESLSDQILEYIQKYYRTPITVQQLSNYFGYHPDYLGKMFKRDLGKSILTHLHHIRIEYAKQLMLVSDMSMHDIAEHIGYNDGAYFSKIFKKIENLSPKQWKLTHKNQP